MSRTMAVATSIQAMSHFSMRLEQARLVHAGAGALDGRNSLRMCTLSGGSPALLDSPGYQSHGLMANRSDGHKQNEVGPLG